MTDSTNPSRRKWTLVLTATVVGALLDQLTKWWAVAVLLPMSPEYVRVVPSFFNLRYVENRGAAWGLFAGLDERYRVAFFVVVSLAAMVFITLFIHRTRLSDRRLLAALTCVFAGAVGNFIDRVHLGYVVDFLDVYLGAPAALSQAFTRWFGTSHWPTFNLADSYITVGVGFMVYEMLFGSDEAIGGMLGSPGTPTPPGKSSGSRS